MDPPPAPTLHDAIRHLGVSNTDSVYYQTQSNPPTFHVVRDLAGSQLETIITNTVDSNTDQQVSSQPNLNPPTFRAIRNINVVDSNTGQPSLNPPTDVVAASSSPVFEKFKKEVESLKVMKRQIQEKIGIARDRNDNLLSGVEEWLNKADDELSKAEKLLEKEAAAKKMFFEEFDQLATKMTPPLLEHKESGKDFVTRVSVFENRDIIVLAKKKIGYTRNSSENVEKLRHEAEKLKVMRRRVQQLIDISISKGELLLYGVEDWVKEVDYEISKVDDFLEEEEEANAKKTWGKIGLCGNRGSLHRYNKSATKMVPPLMQLQELGNTFERGVSIEILPPTQLDVYETKNLEDLATHNSALDAIIAALEDESKQIIGIYGLGGVGKTTLAKEVAARVKKTNLLFVDVAFTFVSQRVDAMKIQKDLENATKRIMEGDKILIIFDDVWEKLNLEELCIPHGSNYMNCKILLTSRSEEVCRDMNAQSIIYVHSLPTQEAWILFKRVVGERLETDANLEPIALKIVKRCGGLPLLIKTVGYALKHESIKSWEVTLIQLQKHGASDIDNNIKKAYLSLKLSYDYLESEEAKSCFLLCGLFHEAENIELEDLVRYAVGLELFDDLNSIEDARNRVRNAVNMLTSSCLLLNVEDDKGCTKMHSVVRDLALLIGSQGNNRYLLKAGKDLTEWLPRDNNAKDLTDYKKTNFDDFLGSFHSMIRMLDKKGPLRAVSKATNHYHDRNIIKDGKAGKVYKGKLSRNGRFMYIAVWRLDPQYRENYIDFRRELEILSDFNHGNISSIFEYLDVDDENIIIYEHAFHGNLHGHLRNPDPELTWSRRLQICLGVAHALNYIHNRGLIHCDINSSKILLDEDWKPKIFGFELSTEYPQSWTRRLQLSRYLRTTSVMTPNYDVQLFGELLIEALCEKKPMLAEGGFNEKVDDNIGPSLRKHIESQSMNYFKNIAYNCLDKKLVEPPSMNQIVKQLEKALELQQQEDLERSSNGDEGASRDRLQIGNLEISLIAIKDATDQFTKVFIGNGGFGTVYRAELVVLDIQSVSSIIGKSKQELPMKIRKPVAIKRHSKKDEQAQNDFFTEIKLLTSCMHPNVVSLFGFSNEADELILVYEYASNRDLSDYLKKKRSRLTWSQRIQICLQVARGINCVHNNNIIHRDIKSKNILLDDNLNAKLADFGLSTLIPTVGGKSTIRAKKVGGTTAYMDPEYRETHEYKKESDIYSFGVVLFEVLSGKMAYDPTYTRENDDGLAPIVRRRFEAGTLTELIDPKMFEEDDEHTITLNRGPTKDSYDLFSKVGHKCLAKTGAERPTMEVVIKTLEEALEAQGKTMTLSKFRLSSIEDATHNFDKTYYMGSDTSGNVYKAQLDHFESNSLLSPAGKNNGEPPAKKRISVAIKGISGRVDENEEGFFSEIRMHTRYKHPNIVPLLGICYEGDNILLVYEHDKSLDDYLRDTDNMTKHTWIQRLHQCLGIAYGLNHLHTLMDRKQEMIHVDVRSANILLGKSGEAKIAYFGFSKLLPANQEASSDTTNNNVHTKVYRCPADYQNTTGEVLKKQSDIYSFGVVLFEIFCGRVAYDPVYTVKNDNGLAPVARQCFIDGTIKKMIDPALKEESVEDILTSDREPILDSVGTYLRIANLCLAENQTERPTMHQVIEELEKAISIQMKFLEIPLFEILSATNNFHEEYLVGYGGFGAVYRAELEVLDIQSVSSIIGKSKDELPRKSKTVAIKRHSKRRHEQAEKDFFTEIKLLSSCKHPNVVSLLGFCIEANEMIIVFEYAPKGSLADYLQRRRLGLTWSQRIEICLQVAHGINCLHTNNIIHRDIKSENILLDENLNAKVSDFALSTLTPTAGDESTILTQLVAGTAMYIDPEYLKTGVLKKESDIYSFGVVLFEVLSGKLTYDRTYMMENDDGLAPIVRRRFNEGTLMELIDPKMLEDEDDDDEHTFNRGPTQDSFKLFSKVGYECLAETQAERPKMEVVIKTLEDALEAQSKVDQAVQLSG